MYATRTSWFSFLLAFTFISAKGDPILRRNTHAVRIIEIEAPFLYSFSKNKYFLTYFREAAVHAGRPHVSCFISVRILNQSWIITCNTILCKRINDIKISVALHKPKNKTDIFSWKKNSSAKRQKYLLFPAVDRLLQNVHMVKFAVRMIKKLVKSLNHHNRQTIASVVKTIRTALIWNVELEPTSIQKSVSMLK